MKTKHILLSLCFLSITYTSEAQFLKKLRKKAEEAAERTILKKTDDLVTKKTEETIDGATGKKDKDNNATNQSDLSSGNTALEINTDAKKEFFKEDVVIKLHENGNLNQTQYFDADQVVVQLEIDIDPEPGYIDSEGFMYGYNKDEGAYNKSAMMAVAGQGMLGPTMFVEGYKLPPEPFMANLQKQQDQGLTANPFNGIVEFAFIYEPEQFRYEDFKESKQTLRGNTYTKFEYLNEPGYEGSYVLFDDKNRLVEIYTNKADTGEQMDAFNMSMMTPGESLIVYEYKPVDVQLPPAREVRGQGQGMMEMVYGSFKKDKNTEDIDEDDYDTSDSKGQVKSVKNALKNNKVTSDMLLESYDFDWEYKTTMVMNSRKKDAINMTILYKDKATYHATEVIDTKNKDMGKVIMLFDTQLNTMVMFMDLQGNQKMFQMYPVPEVKSDKAQLDFDIKELSSKTILNYNCKGIQLENDKSIINVYHSTEAPISLSNFFSFGGNKKMDLPDLDPRLVKQFSNGLVLEMEYIDKKKAKNNFIITGQSLKKEPTSIRKEDYKSMSFLTGAEMMKKN